MTTTLLSIVLSCITAPPLQTSEKPDSLLYIRTTPAGAQILLDGKPLGTSDGLFPIKPGTYKIIVDLQGHEPKEQNITIRDGRITRVELQLDKRPAETASSNSSTAEPSERKFVRVVIGEESMTFQGQETTWEELPALLEKVPNRKQTVLEIAIATEDLTVRQRNTATGRVGQLAGGYGFEYASYIGVHPLGSLGTTGEPPTDESATEVPLRKAVPFGPVIEWTLSQTGDFEFVETPLHEVVDTLNKRFPMLGAVVDREVLARAGVSVDMPITFSVSNVSVRTVLNLLALSDPKLAWTIRRETLLITTAEEEEKSLAVKIYDVAEINELHEWKSDFYPLIRVITTGIAPTTWDELGGPGTIRFGGSVGHEAMIVLQTQQVHGQIAELLGKCERFNRDGDGIANGETSMPGTHDAVTPAEETIQAALREKISVEFREISLSTVVAQLAR
ncbi:MAG: PEGA domain-containing protein, partial [Thermoguttaceae bacterium]